MTFNLNWCFWLLLSDFSSVVLIENILDLADGTITKVQIKISFGFSPFKIDNFPVFIIEIDWLEWRVDHSLVGVVERLQVDLIEPYEFLFSPKFNYDPVSASIGWRSIVWKYVHMSVLGQVCYSELDGLLCQRNLVATWFAYFAEFTKTNVQLNYIQRFLVLQLDP